MIQLTRTLLSLIYGPLYLQGDTQHNEERTVRLLSLSMIACSLAPTLFSLSNTPSGLPSPMKKCLVTFVDLYSLFLCCSFSELKYWSLHMHCPCLLSLSSNYLSFVSVFLSSSGCTDLTIWISGILAFSLKVLITDSSKENEPLLFCNSKFQNCPSVMCLSEMSMTVTPNPRLLAHSTSRCPHFLYPATLSSYYPLSFPCRSPPTLSHSV